jgi:HTH domain
MREKPVAPPDIWDQLNALEPKLVEMARPENSFTTSEFAERYEVSNRAAWGRLQVMKTKGIVEHVVDGINSYWVIVAGGK